MIRKDDLSSQQYRAKHKMTFRMLGNGKYGGYKAGIVNGPMASTPRGKRRLTRKVDALRKPANVH